MGNQTQSTHGERHKSWVLVLGLDLGTTSFKIAMIAVEEYLDGQNPLQLIRNPDSPVTVLENFPGHDKHSLSSIPTCLSYVHKAELPKWGHEANKFQRDEHFDPDLFVANWKLAFHESADPAASQMQRRLQAIAKRMGKEGIAGLAEDFSSALAAFLFEDHEESPILKLFGATMDSFKHIDIVIAVPPGWPRQEHELLSNAVARGVGEKRSFRIFRASETECVLRSWMQGTEIQATCGDILLLLDLGGGTVCISAFRREVAEDGTLMWTHMESHSLTAGSEIVSEEFVKDFRHRLAGVANVRLTSKLLHKARTKFDERKVTFGERISEKDLFIKVVGLKRDDAKGFLEDRMHLSSERILGYFEHSQDQILRKIEEVTDRIAREHGSPPKYCVGAGAYADNILFRRKLKKANHHNMKVSILPNSADSVARGACLTRLHGNFNQFRGSVSKHSIAILTYIDRMDAIKLYPFPARRLFDYDAVEYTPALFWTIRKGDPIQPNHVVEEIGSDPRRRTFEHDEDIVLTDTMFISDSEITKEEEYTVLAFQTTDPAQWRHNMSNLRQRGITGKLYDVTWDMKDVKLEQKDGSFAQMCQKDIAMDPDDRRSSDKRRRMFYKFWLHVSSADIQVSIQTFHTRDRTHTLEVAQKQISMADKEEFESAALEEEYENIGVGEEVSEGSSEDSDDEDYSPRLSKASSKMVRHSPPHRERRVSPPRSKRRLEESSSANIQGPQVCAPQLQGIASAAQTMLGHDPKWAALAEYTHSPYSTPITRQGALHDRGRHVAPSVLENPSRASSRYRTRSSTPMRPTDHLQQPRNRFGLRKSQSPVVSARTTPLKPRIQSSLRTPVVAARKRDYEFLIDTEDDESS